MKYMRNALCFQQQLVQWIMDENVGGSSWYCTKMVSIMPTVLVLYFCYQIALVVVNVSLVNCLQPFWRKVRGAIKYNNSIRLSIRPSVPHPSRLCGCSNSNSLTKLLHLKLYGTILAPKCAMALILAPCAHPGIPVKHPNSNRQRNFGSTPLIHSIASFVESSWSIDIDWGLVKSDYLLLHKQFFLIIKSSC